LEFEERRDSPRSQVDCQMSFRLAGEDRTQEGFCINISGSGVLFEAADPVQLGTALEVHLVPQKKIVTPLTAFVEVVRCTRSGSGKYRIAGAIKGIKGC